VQALRRTARTLLDTLLSGSNREDGLLEGQIQRGTGEPYAP